VGGERSLLSGLDSAAIFLRKDVELDIFLTDLSCGVEPLPGGVDSSRNVATPLDCNFGAAFSRESDFGTKGSNGRSIELPSAFDSSSEGAVVEALRVKFWLVGDRCFICCLALSVGRGEDRSSKGDFVVDLVGEGDDFADTIGSAGIGLSSYLMASRSVSVSLRRSWLSDRAEPYALLKPGKVGAIKASSSVADALFGE